MMFQSTIPPVPPIPSVPSIPIWMTDDGPKVILMIVLAGLLATTVILWPIMRAIGRRMEHRGGGGEAAALRAELDDLRHRMGEIDGLQTRIAELEERLDFAERLLAQGKDAERLPR